MEAIKARSVRNLASGGRSARRALVVGRPVFCGNESSSAISNQCTLPANRDGGAETAGGNKRRVTVNEC